jgi:hypothetical protein
VFIRFANKYEYKSEEELQKLDAAPEEEGADSVKDIIDCNNESQSSPPPPPSSFANNETTSGVEITRM